MEEYIADLQEQLITAQHRFMKDAPGSLLYRSSQK